MTMPVRVADEDERPLDAVEDPSQVGRVGFDAAQRVGRRDDGEAGGPQAVDDAVERRGLGEGAVHEHDGRLVASGGRERHVDP